MSRGYMPQLLEKCGKYYTGGHNVGEKTKARKILSILRSVVYYAFLVICVFAVVVSIVAKRNAGKDEGVPLFGYQMMFVRSDSMEKSPHTDVSEFDIGSIPVKSMVFVENVPTDPEEAKAWYGTLEEGDVLTFRYQVGTGMQETITHRIIDIEKDEESGHCTITLQGDNKGDENESITLGTQVIDTSKDTMHSGSFNYVIGKVVGVSYLLGLLIHIISQPVGIICVIIVPCLIIIIFEVIRIVNVFGSEKKKKYAEEKAQADSEIEALRRQLEELQRMAQQSSSPPDDDTGEAPETVADTEETNMAETATHEADASAEDMAKESTHEDTAE